MCGFAGYIDFQKRTNEQVLKEMTHAIAYRGPDDAGYQINHDTTADIGFGHRRLSIIDLSPLGHQPMMFKNITLVFNGEIYNYDEIREELIKEYKHTFISHSDTEVILHAYDQWGISCIQKFNGMFAFALHDRERNKMFLVRDRAGVKPFYYYQKSGLILFGSELKSFHAHPAFVKEINNDALSLYLQYGYIPAPHTIFNNAFKVLPGSYIEIDITNGNLKETIYWDVLNCYNEQKLDISENEALQETENLLVSACNYRMVSDVPVGVFLSGGYDSSCVAALLQKDRTDKIKTFTIGFTESKYNEAGYAKKVADYLGTNHTEYYCTEQDAKSIIPELSFIFDEPFGDSSAIPTILVSRIARKDVTVALSADAGDETFAGYSRYVNFRNNYHTLSKIPSIFRQPLGNAMKLLNPERLLNLTGKYRAPYIYDAVAEMLSDGLSGPTVSKYSIQRISSAKMNGLLIKQPGKPHTFFDDGKLLNSSNDEITKLMAIDYKTYMVDDILTKVDRATMSVSLEGREPLLDFRLIEYVSRLPLNYKLNGQSKKYLLKEIVHKYLPKEIMERPKMGFGIPLVNWFRTELKFYLDEYLGETRIKSQGIFSHTFINQIVQKYHQGKNDDFELIWFLLTFQLWYEKWMEN